MIYLLFFVFLWGVRASEHSFIQGAESKSGKV